MKDSKTLIAKILVLSVHSILVGSGCGPKPDHNANWYYYWEKDNVIIGLDRTGSPASRWDWSVDAANEGVSGAAHGPSDGYVLTDLCITEPNRGTIKVWHDFPPKREFYIGAATTYGIECAAAVMAHEKQHIESYKFKISPGQSDTDKDRLADSLEGIFPYFFIIGNRDTYDLASRIHPDYAAYGDNEFISRQAETAGVGLADTSQDWSKEGAQWRH